ncbi:MAG: M20/M25/M40 family metallo-hydrolase, partial [Planctomycetes bacterium]|nr:M20/M25/M40 family metallo-hydrolase [Planctomycetota bacterium]
FNRGPWWGRVVAPEPRELVCNTEAWSAGTRGPSRGRLLLAPQTVEELAAMKGQLEGVWLLDPPLRGPFDQVRDAVEAEGGFGFVGGARNDLLITGGRMNVDFDALPQVPFVRLTAEDHDALRNAVKAGEEVVVEFDIRNHFRKGPIPLYNVIADLPGTTHPHEFVVVGGHLDSWDGATGTTDNGTGTATTIEAARILTAIGSKPGRTIRFMLWSGEEQGLLGSRAWVQAHKDEMEQYSACLVHDGGTNYVSGIAGMAEMHPQLDTVFAPVLDLSGEMPFRIRDIEAFRPIGSDHESFTAAGVPGFFWDQAGRANYTHTHHTQFDTYDAAIPEYQKHSSVVIATGALGLANLPELLTRENMKVQRGFGGGGRRGGARGLGLQLGDDGVSIAGIGDGTPAAKAGFAVGDKLLKVGDTKIESRRDLFGALRGASGTVTVTVERGGEQLELKVPTGR